MDIEKQNATIDTMSVTIRALHVNHKQMTLAVFRQLPIRQENTDSIIWGLVRYDIKDKGDAWIVFSQDDRLFRRAIKRGYALEASDYSLKRAEKRLGIFKHSPQSIGAKEAQDTFDTELEKYERDVIAKDALREYEHRLEHDSIQLFIAI